MIFFYNKENTNLSGFRSGFQEHGTNFRTTVIEESRRVYLCLHSSFVTQSNTFLSLSIGLPICFMISLIAGLIYSSLTCFKKFKYKSSSEFMIFVKVDSTVLIMAEWFC